MLLRVQILSTGKFLVLQQNGVLTVDINSTLFNNQDAFLGSYSYPGKMPLEPNRAAIQNAHLITSDAGLRTFYVQVWLGQIPWTVARLDFTIEDSTIVYNLLIDNALIAGQIKKLKLNELADPNINEQLNFATAADYYTYINSTVTAPRGTVPMVFAPYKNAAAYNIIDPADYADYPDLDLPLGNYINAWEIDAGTGDGNFIQNPFAAPSRYVESPFFLLTYVLKRMALFFGYKPVGKWLTEDGANRLLLHSNVPTITPSIIGDYYSFMPAIGLPEFIKEVRTRFGVLIYFDQLSKTCLIETLTNLQNSDDITDLSSAQLKSYREIGGNVQAYQISQGYGDADTAYSDFEKTTPAVLSIGDVSGLVDITDVQLVGVVTKMISEISPTEALATNWKVPFINQPMYGNTPFDQISSVESADQNSFPLRFLYNHGLQEDVAGNLYPYISVDNTDVSNNVLTAFSLALDAGYLSFLAIRHFYEFKKASKPFEMTFLLSSQAFLNLRAKSKVAVKDFNRATVYCLIDKISADLGSAETIIAKATLYPILLPNNTRQIIPPTPDVPPEPPYDNGVVYIKLVLRNHTNTNYMFPPPPYAVNADDVYAEFYLDAAATTPKDVVALDVRLTQKYYAAPGGGFVSSTTTINCTSTGQESELLHQAEASSTQGGGLQNWTYELATSTAYTIIP